MSEVKITHEGISSYKNPDLSRKGKGHEILKRRRSSSFLPESC